MANRKANGEGKLFSFPLPPLPHDLPLPPLPPIRDKSIYERATTHTSLYAVARITHDLDTANYVQIHDYEKLEYMGDRLVGGLCADIVVDEVHPNMRQGVATMVHDRLVCNDTLAQLADRYGITERIKTSADAQHIKQQIIKLRGSAFEAWVAGVYYDRLAGGRDALAARKDYEETDREEDIVSCTAGTTQPPVTAPIDLSFPKGPNPDTDDPPSDSSLHLRALYQETATSEGTSPTGQLQIASDSKSLRHGEAIDYLLEWLRPMYLPILEFTLTVLRKYQAQLERDQPAAKKPPRKASVRTSKKHLDAEFVKEEERLSGGAVNALWVFANNQHHVEPVYRDTPSGPGMWRMRCELSLPGRQKIIRQADKPTKKLAKAVAALYVCRANREQANLSSVSKPAGGASKSQLVKVRSE